MLVPVTPQRLYAGSCHNVEVVCLGRLTTWRMYAGSCHSAEDVCWFLSQRGGCMLERLTTRRLFTGASHHAEIVCWSVSQRKAAPGLLTPRVRFVCAFPAIKELLRRAARRSG